MRRLAVVAILMMLPIAELPAAEPAPTTQPAFVPAGPLAGLPSRPGPHIAKIRALGDGQWLNLGQPEADPKWGQGRGRSWCAKMNFSPELRGAFHTGDGVHAFIKPDGHYMDDFFFYDINAHKWICVYPGAKAGEDQGLHLGENGMLLNKQGDPVPPGLLAHNYDQVTYDPDQHKLAFIPKGGATGWWITMKCMQIKELAGPANEQMKGKGYSPWYYNTQTGKFERHVIKGKSPMSSSAGCFIYLPKHRKYYLREPVRGEHWLYDPAKQEWSPAAAPPGEAGISGDSVSCYDSKRGLFYLGGGGGKDSGGAFAAYDGGEDKWTVLPKIPGQPRITGNSGHLTYDSANDVVVAAVRGLKGLFIYDAAAGKWLNEEVIPAKGLAANATYSAFYDPANNVHYYLQAGDSREGGVIWVYRYKKAD